MLINWLCFRIRRLSSLRVLQIGLVMWDFYFLVVQVVSSRWVSSLGSSGWEALWSGAIGGITPAVLSASGAAWVAVHVLNRSAAEQRSLSENAIRAQRERDAKVDRDQRERDVEAIRIQAERDMRLEMSQNRALAEQLNSQRLEASRDRAHAAISDAIAFVQRLGPADPDDVPLQREILLSLNAAMVRWRLEVSGDEEMVEELGLWPDFLEKVVLYRRLRRAQGNQLLNESFAEVRSLGVNWFRGDADHRKIAVSRFRTYRLSKASQVRA